VMRVAAARLLAQANAVTLVLTRREQSSHVAIGMKLCRTAFDPADVE
jgi:hypothetical protein